MMWGYYDGWSWLWMAAMMVFFWGGITAAIIFTIRYFTSGRKDDGAVDILRKRFASGEISQEEFDNRRRTLTQAPE